MSKRWRKGRPKDSGGGDPGGREGGGEHRPYDPRAIEGTQAETHRLMRRMHFSTIDEANDYLRRQAMLTSFAPIAAETPLEAAQDLMYRAFGETGRKRVRLARRALEHSADCADAYVVLAEETARTLEGALELYEAGAAAGERALGRTWLEVNAGSLWMRLEARGYMRALGGSASCLWALERRGEAIARYQEMLRLNRHDNQGVRYHLICHLIEEDRDAEARRLLAAFAGDGTAWWAYSRALLSFRAAGAGRTPNMHLGRAMRANPYVVLLLLGMVAMPPGMPRTFKLGDPDEAVLYVDDAHEGWSDTEGANDWLDERWVRLGPPRREKGGHGRGLTGTGDAEP